MKWEYQVVTRKLEDQYLNPHGDEGWELVSLVPAAVPDDGYVFVFKKPKAP